MKPCRTLIRALAIAAATLAFGVECARAQESLPRESLPRGVVTADQLTPEHRKQVDAYVGHWAATLCAGDNIGEAREKLTGRIVLGETTTSEAFRQVYGEAVISKIGACAKSPQLKIKLNAMIVVAKVSHDAAISLVEDGLGDESASVRYWAARAVKNLGDGDKLTRAQQEQVLKVLEKSLEIENSPFALAELLSALGTLKIEKAKESLLNALTKRVVLHRDNAALNFKPVRTALKQSYVKLQSAHFEDPGAVDDQISRISRVAYLYMDMAADQLAADPNLPSIAVTDKDEMIRQSDKILRFAHAAMEGVGVPPAAVNGPLRISDWSGLERICDAWRRLLTEVPFNFTDDELSIPEAKEPGRVEADGKAATASGAIE